MRDNECFKIFVLILKYLPKLEKLNSGSNQDKNGYRMQKITLISSKEINEDIKYLNKLKVIDLRNKNNNKIDNEI